MSHIQFGNGLYLNYPSQVSASMNEVAGIDIVSYLRLTEAQLQLLLAPQVSAWPMNNGLVPAYNGLVPALHAAQNRPENEVGLQCLLSAFHAAQNQPENEVVRQCLLSALHAAQNRPENEVVRHQCLLSALHAAQNRPENEVVGHQFLLSALRATQNRPEEVRSGPAPAYNVMQNQPEEVRSGPAPAYNVMQNRPEEVRSGPALADNEIQEVKTLTLEEIQKVMNTRDLTAKEVASSMERYKEEGLPDDSTSSADAQGVHELELDLKKARARGLPEGWTVKWNDEQNEKVWISPDGKREFTGDPQALAWSLSSRRVRLVEKKKSCQRSKQGDCSNDLSIAKAKRRAKAKGLPDGWSYLLDTKQNKRYWLSPCGEKKCNSIPAALTWSRKCGMLSYDESIAKSSSTPEDVEASLTLR